MTQIDESLDYNHSRLVSSWCCTQKCFN